MLLPGFIDTHMHPLSGGGYAKALSLDTWGTAIAGCIVFAMPVVIENIFATIGVNLPDFYPGAIFSDA